jgi:hypothetical protein
MNEQQRAVIQQALEAAYLAGFQATGEGYNAEYPFEGCNPEANVAWVHDRDNALRQLLEQPADHSEQDLDMVENGDLLTIVYMDGLHTGKRIAKREWVGLNYEEAKEIYTCIHGHDSEIRLCRAIEAKLKEKNT